VVLSASWALRLNFEGGNPRSDLHCLSGPPDNYIVEGIVCELGRENLKI
jgi:hypothetical protein